MKRKDIRNEILKYMSPKELEEAIKVKRTELKGLISPEGAEFIIAKELGIKIEDTQKNETEFLQGLGEVFTKIRKEKKRPKSIKEILQNLSDKISQYCSEVLDPLFVDKGKYKQTIHDWKYNLQNNLDQFKEELFKSSWLYDLDDDGTCHKGEPDKSCEYPEDWDYKKQGSPDCCKKCFEEVKEEWCNDYKRGIDISIEYFKTYFKISNIRKEYLTKPTKQTHLIN